MDSGSFPSCHLPEAPPRVSSAVFELLSWLRSVRPDLFLLIVSPVDGHKLIPPEE